MNQTIVILIGFLLFALITAILYVIGLKKKMGEEEELAKRLLNISSLKVIDYLKSHETLSLAEIASLVQGLEARNFYSRKRARVQNSQEFKYQLVDFMLQEGLVEEERNKQGKKVYRLARKDR